MSYSDDWIQILNGVNDFGKKARYTWFRGHNNSDYKLNSGLYRVPRQDKNSYLSTERYYYELFRRLGGIHNNSTGWKLLFIMQHHGVRTRLLDWSESFAVALYFACKGWNHKENDCAVWLLHPLKLNKLTIGEEVFNITGTYQDCLSTGKDKNSFSENSTAIYPLKNSNRILSQKGMFTIQGTSGEALEEEYDGKLLEKGILKKITITNRCYEDAMFYLKQSGLDHYSMFPDLDGLAQYVNEQGYMN